MNHGFTSSLIDFFFSLLTTDVSDVQQPSPIGEQFDIVADRRLNEQSQSIQWHNGLPRSVSQHGTTSTTVTQQEGYAGIQDSSRSIDARHPDADVHQMSDVGDDEHVATHLLNVSQQSQRRRGAAYPDELLVASLEIQDGLLSRDHRFGSTTSDSSSASG